MTIHQCDTCQKYFKEKRELRHHVKRVHKGELNFLCEQCSRPFVDSYALKKHIANVHDIDKKFKCTQCDRGFGVRSHYNEHMIKVHEESHKLTCEFCGKVLFDRKSLLRHVMSLHKRQDCPFACPFELCLKKFSINAILLRHMANVHGGQEKATIKCDLCPMLFHHDLLLQNHVKKNHQIMPPPLMPINDNDSNKETEEKRKIICDQCSRPFGDTDLLNRHIANVHADEKRFKCDLCSKGFGVKSNFNAHMSKVHGAKLPCEFCGKILFDVKSLRSHVLSLHKREECRFECEICHKKFSRNSYLIRHVSDVHKHDGSGETLHCSQCGDNSATSFRHKVLLEDHIKKKHPLDVVTSKKVSCQFCGRTVTNAKSLRLHILAKHKRQDCPFKCDICEKKFPRNSLLVRHVSKVHKNEEVENIHCPTCGETFKNELRMQEHIENCHKICATDDDGIGALSDRFCDTLEDFDSTVKDEEVYEDDCEAIIECDVKIKEEETLDFENIFMEEDDEEGHSSPSRLIVQCEDCLAVFLSPNDYESHDCSSVKVEEGEENNLSQLQHTPLSCPGCKTVFKNNSELDDHDCPSQPFKCKFCDKRYTRKESLRRHTREEHSEDGKSQPKIRGQGHTCNTCGMAFEQSYLFKLHMKKAHNEEIHIDGGEQGHKCEFCEKAFFRKESVRRHIREAHEGKLVKEEGVIYECGQCEKKYERRDVLRRHVRLVHEAVQAGKCDLCDGAFFRDISRHLIVSHTSEKSNVECPLCQKSIGKNYSLKRHIRVFHTEATVDEAEAEAETEATTTEGKKKGQQPKLCDSCGTAFESLGSLMSHKKEVHQLELEAGHNKKNMKIPCPHCAKPIVGTHGLKLHIKAVHEKRKDFMCNRCGRRFSQLISLQTHVKHVHCGVERAFSCKHCQKNFTSPRSRHLHVEKDHKTMQCPTCQRYFAFKKHLQDHSCLAPPTTTTTTTITKSAMTTKKDHAISSAMGLPPTTSQQQQCKDTVY